MSLVLALAATQACNDGSTSPVDPIQKDTSGTGGMDTLATSMILLERLPIDVESLNYSALT
jgi:hypothetical protein